KYNKSRDILMKVKNSSILFIDDINKIGNITESRGAEIFALLQKLADNRKTLYVTSQETIAEFCKKIPEDAREKAKGYDGPNKTRWADLCREILVTEQMTFF